MCKSIETAATKRAVHEILIAKCGVSQSTRSHFGDKRECGRQAWQYWDSLIKWLKIADNGGLGGQLTGVANELFQIKDDLGAVTVSQLLQRQFPWGPVRVGHAEHVYHALRAVVGVDNVDFYVLDCIWVAGSPLNILCAPCCVQAVLMRCEEEVNMLSAERALAWWEAKRRAQSIRQRIRQHESGGMFDIVFSQICHFYTVFFTCHFHKNTCHFHHRQKQSCGPASWLS